MMKKNIFIVSFFLLITFCSYVSAGGILCEAQYRQATKIDYNCAPYNECQAFEYQNLLFCATVCGNTSESAQDMNHAFSCYDLARKKLTITAVDTAGKPLSIDDHFQMQYQLDKNAVNYIDIAIIRNNAVLPPAFEDIFIKNKRDIYYRNLSESSNELAKNLVCVDCYSKLQISVKNDLNSETYLAAISYLSESINAENATTNPKVGRNSVVLALVLEKYEGAVLTELTQNIFPLGFRVIINLYTQPGFQLVYIIISIILFVFGWWIANLVPSNELLPHFGAIREKITISISQMNKVTLLTIISTLWVGTTIGFSLASANQNNLIQAIVNGGQLGIIYLTSSVPFLNSMFLATYFSLAWYVLTIALVFAIFAIVFEKISDVGQIGLWLSAGAVLFLVTSITTLSLPIIGLFIVLTATFILWASIFIFGVIMHKLIDYFRHPFKKKQMHTVRLYFED